MIDVCFVYFRTCTLAHLDASWYSLSRQDFSNIQRVFFLDNNSPDAPADIQRVLDRYPIPVPVLVCYDKHGVVGRTHPHSLNKVCQAADGPWIFFTRADYILDFEAVACFCNRARRGRFLSGWREDMYPLPGEPEEALIDIESTGWREQGPQVFRQWPKAYKGNKTYRDAGVWMTERKSLAAAGWADERMHLWGANAQSQLQWVLNNKVKVTPVIVQRYCFFHVWHAAPRSNQQGRAQLAALLSTPAERAERGIFWEY